MSYFQKLVRLFPNPIDQQLVEQEASEWEELFEGDSEYLKQVASKGLSVTERWAIIEAVEAASPSWSEDHVKEYTEKLASVIVALAKDMKGELA